MCVRDSPMNFDVSVAYKIYPITASPSECFIVCSLLSFSTFLNLEFFEARAQSLIHSIHTPNSFNPYKDL